jgi:hypothetical protein
MFIHKNMFLCKTTAFKTSSSILAKRCPTQVNYRSTPSSNPGGGPTTFIRCAVSHNSSKPWNMPWRNETFTSKRISVFVPALFIQSYSKLSSRLCCSKITTVYDISFQLRLLLFLLMFLLPVHSQKRLWKLLHFAIRFCAQKFTEDSDKSAGSICRTEDGGGRFFLKYIWFGTRLRCVMSKKVVFLHPHWDNHKSHSHYTLWLTN